MPDPTFLWHLIHPLSGDGYQFWSGIGSDFGEATIVISILLIVRHHNCHVKGCPRLGHADEHGHPACKRHHTKRDALGVDPHAE